MIREILTILTIILLASCSLITTKKDGPVEKKTKTVKLELSQILFYNAPKENLTNKLRLYQEKFKLQNLDYLWYELFLINHNIENTDLILTEKWFNSKDSLIAKKERKVFLDLFDDNLGYNAGFKQDNGWERGLYRLEILLNNNILGKKEFYLY